MKKQEIVLKQKEIIANFYANLALAWLSFGIISPLYNPVKDMIRLISGLFLAIIFGGLFIFLSIKTLE